MQIGLSEAIQFYNMLPYKINDLRNLKFTSLNFITAMSRQAPFPNAQASCKAKACPLRSVSFIV